MSNLTWSTLETSNPERVKVGEVPSRFALTMVALCVRNVDDPVPELLLCNPHPESWNNWQLPYGSVTGDLDLATKLPLTTDDITKALEEQSASLLTSDHDAIDSQLSSMLGDSVELHRRTPLFKDFSVKFSATAKVWTAYMFSYFSLAVSHSMVPTVESRWVPLAGDAARELAESGAHESLPLADNTLNLFVNRDRLLELLNSH